MQPLRHLHCWTQAWLISLNLLACQSCWKRHNWLLSRQNPNVLVLQMFVKDNRACNYVLRDLTSMSWSLFNYCIQTASAAYRSDASHLLTSLRFCSFTWLTVGLSYNHNYTGNPVMHAIWISLSPQIELYFFFNYYHAALALCSQVKHWQTNSHQLK